MGKAIYQPKGRAREYAPWAVNFYNGCSANCKYCYCKRGPLGQLWSDKPLLKKTLVNEEKAIEIFLKELKKNINVLQEQGLFFNFSSDPLLKETMGLNCLAMGYARKNNVPVTVLTKQTQWLDWPVPHDDGFAIGFTLTGMDLLEPGAPTNQERIDALEELHSEGHKNLWASIEPVISVKQSLKMVEKIITFVDHIKIGILSGGETITKADAYVLVLNMCSSQEVRYFIETKKIYFKDSLLELAGISRENLPPFCVDRDYRFWNK